MNILITGGTGLLGSDLCRRISQKHQVTGWARRLSEQEPSGWLLESRDVTDPLVVQQGIEKLHPRLVIHTAALTDVDACEKDPEAAQRMNADAAGNVAAACAESGIPLIHLSTDYVFDGASARPYRETDDPNPINVYGQSKLEGERRALALSSKTLVVRVSGLFGPARENFVSMAAKRFRAGEAVPAVTDQINSPSYTVDLAEAIDRLAGMLERNPAAADRGGPLHGIFHLANRGAATRMQVAEWIAKLLGKPASLIRETRWADLGRPAARPPRTQMDCSRFAALFGTELRRWEDAVRVFLC